MNWMAIYHEEYVNKILPSRYLLLTVCCMLNGDIWICTLEYFFLEIKLRMLKDLSEPIKSTQSHHQGLCSWQCGDASWQSSSPAPGRLPCWPPTVDILNWSKLTQLIGGNECFDVFWGILWLFETLLISMPSPYQYFVFETLPISIPPAAGSSARIFPTGSVESWAAVNP